MAPTRSAGVPSSVPQHEKTDVFHGKNTCVHLRVGMSYSAVDCTFDVNESTICIK